jgi:hypothetical protein
MSRGSQYPFYHSGKYLEEYFLSFYKSREKEFPRKLIPIFWTDFYNKKKNVQNYLDSLSDGSYFAVSQHDDAVRERLPNDTISFEAGGNGNGLPIPLICSPIPKKYLKRVEKDILCSFVGGKTHKVRGSLVDKLRGDERFFFRLNSWVPNIPLKNGELFFRTTLASKFALAPRGYGPTSFRLYEIFQLGAVPIYVWQGKKWLPFQDFIKWDDICISVHADDIEKIPTLVDGISEKEREKMVLEGKAVFDKFFTMRGMSETILKILKKTY